MMLPSILLLGLLMAASTASLVALYRVLQVRGKHRMLGGAHGRSCETLDCIGISVLGTDVYDLAQVENLLAVEYSRYEAILVLDSQQHTPEFEALIARYRMISVDYYPTCEFPVEGVRGLYRSRTRTFRRLIIVDRAQDCTSGDLDAAADVASYDYLLPVGKGQFLLPDAVERLSLEVGERPVGSLGLIRTCVGEPVRLYCREMAAAAGGFGNHPTRGLSRRQVKCIWEPLFRRDQKPSPLGTAVRVVGALMLAAGIGAALWMGYWGILAVLLTVALAWCCAGYAVLLLGEDAGAPERLYSGWRSE